MAKKKNKEIPQIEQDYYKLKTDAVDRLKDAHEGKVKKVSDKELNKYKSSKLDLIPIWVKALFIKFWFAGAICFFFYWGLSIYLSSWLDQMLVFGLGLGIVTDILTNNVLRFLSSSDKESESFSTKISSQFSLPCAHTACTIIAASSLSGKFLGERCLNSTRNPFMS